MGLALRATSRGGTSIHVKWPDQVKLPIWNDSGLPWKYSSVLSSMTSMMGTSTAFLSCLMRCSSGSSQPSVHLEQQQKKAPPIFLFVF